MARLPAAEREAILLQVVDHLPLSEVAGRLGRTAGATKMLLYRARETMRSDSRAA